MNRSADPGQPSLVSYPPQADQQSRPFDTYERFDGDKPYESYENAASHRARSRTPSSRAFLFVMLTALNTTVASILSVVITLGVVRRERSEVQPQDARVAVRSEPTTPHVAIQQINLAPIGSRGQPLRLEPHKPAQLSLQIEPREATNEPFILALSNAPAGTKLSGATQISSDSWFLSPSSADRLEIAVPEWSTSVFEITLVLRHTDGLVAGQTKAWIVVPPPPETTQLYEEFLKWNRERGAHDDGYGGLSDSPGARRLPVEPAELLHRPRGKRNKR